MFARRPGLVGDRTLEETHLGGMPPQPVIGRKELWSQVFIEGFLGVTLRPGHGLSGYKAGPGLRARALAAPRMTRRAAPAYHAGVPDSPAFASPESDNWLVLTEAALPIGDAVSWVEMPGCGGIVGFFGVVRDNAEGRDGVVAVEYEAYPEPVRRAMSDLVDEARKAEPSIGRIALWHRVGRLVVGDTSVAVVVSAPHRGEAFAACRYVIDTLKATFPIWKHEFWEGGSGWSPSSQPLRTVRGGGGEQAP